jgi:hypothetical protein
MTGVLLNGFLPLTLMFDYKSISMIKNENMNGFPYFTTVMNATVE